MMIWTTIRSDDRYRPGRLILASAGSGVYDKSGSVCFILFCLAGWIERGVLISQKFVSFKELDTIYAVGLGQRRTTRDQQHLLRDMKDDGMYLENGTSGVSAPM